ncbi:maleylpyruvate isomerase N-terminal domain-containing protein [Kytococcus sp. Marseille-QA3725]
MPRPLSIPLEEGRRAFLEALQTFRAGCDSLDDFALLAPSRAHGWSRLDCIVHVRTGLQEMLAGACAGTRAPADTDAASYWTAFAAQEDDDPVPGILLTRRTAAAYTRPRHALQHLEEVCTGWARHAPTLPDDRIAFQGLVLTAGDFLATWAVELVVHQLDLDLPAGAPSPPVSALGIARRTVDALGTAPVDEPDDARAVLAGFGR